MRKKLKLSEMEVTGEKGFCKEGGVREMGTDLTKQREAQLCDFRRLFGIYYFGFPLGFKISTADGSSYF